MCGPTHISQQAFYFALSSSLRACVISVRFMTTLHRGQNHPKDAPQEV